MLKLVDKLFLGNSEFKFVRVQVPLLTFYCPKDALTNIF